MVEPNTVKAAALDDDRASSDGEQSGNTSGTNESEPESELASQTGKTQDKSTESFAERWSRGDLAIDRGGVYKLDADVETSGILSIALEEDEEATIDLAGHDVVARDVECAIDLTENKGKVRIAGSSEPGAPPESTIVVESSETANAASVVATRPDGARTGADAGTAKFANIQFELRFRLDGNQDASRDFTAVRIDPSHNELQHAKDIEIDLAFESCWFVVAENEATKKADSEASSGNGSELKLSAIDAGCRAVVLSGKTLVSLEVGGKALDSSANPAFVSRCPASFELGSDIEFLERGVDASPVSGHVAFGFPESAVESDSVEATVACALQRDPIPASVTKNIVAPAGYELRFVDAQGAGQGLAGIALSAQGMPAADDTNSDAVVVSGEKDLGSSAAAALGSADAKNDARDIDRQATGDAIRSAKARVMGVVAQTFGIDLNAAWKAQNGSLKAPYTISQGGTYYLSADMEASSYLVVDAPDADVRIEFRGHALTLDGGVLPARKTMLTIARARTVVLDGTSDSGTSALLSSGEADVSAIASESDACALSIQSLHVKLFSKTNAQRNLSTHAVRLTAGSATLDSCTLEMVMNNQTLTSKDLLNDKNPEPPSAVYAGESVKSLSISNCTVAGLGSQGFALEDVADTTSIGNSYAVYSLADSTTVSGGSYRAESALGNATCIYASALHVEGGDVIQLEASAGQIAAGIFASREASVRLDAPLRFGVAGNFEGNATAEAALRASVENAYVFGTCAPSDASSAYSVLLMLGNKVETANEDAEVIGSFDAGLGVGERGVLEAALRTSLPDGVCDPRVEGDRVLFRFDAAKAAARVGSRSYATIDAASAALKNGETLVLLKDVGDIAVTNVTSATVDLNGHSASSLRYSASGSGNGLVVEHGKVTGTTSAAGARVGVYHASASPLVLRDVAIAVSASNEKTYGVSAAAKAGKLTIGPGTSVDVTVTRLSSSASASAYGLFMANNGPETEVVDATIYARTASAGVAVYGVYTTKRMTVSRSKIAALGADGTTAAAYVGGSLDAQASTFDAKTTASAQTVAGIWARTVAPKASDISIDACMVNARSTCAVGANSNYACLLGATSETGTVTPSGAWRLSGTNTFMSSGTMHIGCNVGAIELGNDFALSAASQAPLVVSQAARKGDLGASFAGPVQESTAQDVAETFKAKPGSHYDGSVLAAVQNGEAYQLVWRHENDVDGKGVVAVEHDGQVARYASLDRALAAAKSGDIVRLLADVAETGSQSISCDDLVLDLGAHTLLLRAGAQAIAGSSRAGAALAFAGSGTLSVVNGSLGIDVGAATESSSGATYQGIAVSGAGTLAVGADAHIDVRYTGSTSANAAQRQVDLCGIAVLNGGVKHYGEINVVAAQADAGLGAMNAYGIYAVPSGQAKASIDIAQGATVKVDNATGPLATKNNLHAEQSATQAGPQGLRELKVDSVNDPELYQAIVKKFQQVASFDDPNDSTARDTFSSSIYYAQGMVLEPEDTSLWYYGLRVWAYSDVVKPADVGKKSAMVPAHIFISAPYDTPAQAYGIYEEGSAAGSASVHVAGSVDASCAHGDAFALDVRASASGAAECSVKGASLNAVAEKRVRFAPLRPFDLRDFISFSSEYKERVAYSNVANAKLVDYESSVARDVRADAGANIAIDGDVLFGYSAIDGAAIEADAFTVGGSFALAQSSQMASVANGKGANSRGAVFAKTSGASALDAAVFEDAYGTYAAQNDEHGNAVWGARDARQLVFKAGDAVVKRIAGSGPVDLRELAQLAAHPTDQRQSYELVGWSESSDENAVSGYTAWDAQVNPSTDTTYYAVYKTDYAQVPLVFTNVFDETGTLQATQELQARYGQTVGEALAASGAVLPQPKDYTDASAQIRYRFLGWYPYSSSSAVSSLLYSPEQVGDLAVTLALNGMTSGKLELRATYAAVPADSHLVAFDVDGTRSACLVADGDHPVYRNANNANTNYTSPAKQVSDAGKTYRFESWFVDDDSDGELDQGEASYASVLPRATGDCVYTANWESKWSDVTYTFYIKYYDEEKNTLVNDGVRTIETSYEKNAQQLADDVAVLGSSFGYGGKVYTLDGWSTRKTDKEPLYDKDNPIPSPNSDQRALTSSYATKFYGVYTEQDHKVNVSFHDGATVLGSAIVTSAVTSVAQAFTATGAASPLDKSDAQVFLGWALSAGATSPLSRTSVLIETLVGGTDATLALYAVYGPLPVYPVLLRSADGSSVYYQVGVKRDSSVSAALASAGESAIRVPQQQGSIFTGFSTASKQLFGLDQPVSGPLDLYASYEKVKVTTPDSAKLQARATLASAALTAKASSLGLTDASVAFTDRSSADSPIVSTMAKNGYSVLKCYDMRVYVTDAAARTELVTGDIGSVSARVYVGPKYRNAKVRVFWLGEKNGAETVMNSAEKTVDDEGYISVSIGNYTVGDVDEGGNIAIAYIEGGAGNGKLASGGSGKALSVPGSQEGAQLGANDLGSKGLGAASLGSGTDGATLARNGSSKGALAAASGSAELASGSGLQTAGASALASGKPVDGGQDPKDADGQSEQGGESPSPFEGWDSNGVVLVLLMAAIVALALRKGWLLFAGKRRDDEDEEEVADFETRYAGGIHF